MAVNGGLIYALYWNRAGAPEDRHRTLDIYDLKADTSVGTKNRHPTSADAVGAEQRAIRVIRVVIRSYPANRARKLARRRPGGQQPAARPSPFR